MYTFNTALKKLGGSEKVKLQYATTMEKIDDNCIGIKHHNTFIVKMYSNGVYELNNGGFKSRTTKKRINQYAPINIYQYDFEWYYGDGKPFENGMRVE